MNQPNIVLVKKILKLLNKKIKNKRPEQAKSPIIQIRSMQTQLHQQAKRLS